MTPDSAQVGVTIQPWLLLVAPIAAAIVGGFGVWVGALITSRAENKRSRTRLACEIAVKEWETHLDMAKQSAKRTGKRQITPAFAAYVYTHMKILDLVERDRLTPDEIRKVAEHSISISGAMEKMQTPVTTGNDELFRYPVSRSGQCILEHVV